MRFALIDAEKAEFPVRTMCRLLDVSESGFFAWQGRPASQRQRDDMIYLAHIRTAFELSNRTYGSPRMHRELVDEGLPIGRRRTARLMRENGLAARQKRRFKRTTDSTHAWPVVPNLLDQDFAAEAPDQKWSADISYIWTAEGWLYLAVLVDLFLTTCRRLGSQRQAEEGFGAACPAYGACHATPAQWSDPSFRPRQPVLLHRLSGGAEKT